MPAADVTADQRRYIKAVNFGLIYGMSAFGLAVQLNIERSAAQQFIDKYFARYPGVAAYMQRTRELARSVNARNRQTITDPDSWDGVENDGWWEQARQKGREGR